VTGIVLTDVTRIHRGGTPAVANVSLEIPAGAFCVLTGPAGSGKSTLLRLIAGVEPPTAGVIEIGDAVRQSWRAGRDDVAELIDPQSLRPRRTLYDNMSHGLTAHGLSRKDAQERVLRAADALALAPVLARRPAQVSAGERSRAALARAFTRQPRALLFDEPLANLEPRERLALRRRIRELHRTSGVTTVYATHDAADALALADLLVVMENGAVVEAGPPAELYDRPRRRRVAELLGAPPMNILPVRANQTGLSLEDGTHLGGASVMTTAVYAFLGVRPEKLFVLDDAAPQPGAKLPVTVEEVEAAGADVYVHGRVGGHPVTARLASRPEIGPDGRLVLGARREHLHMFDVESGERL